MPAPSASPRASRLSPGTVVGGAYRIEALLGQGSMGAVYEATELGSGILRALKVISPALVADPKARHRFEREARLGARIPSYGVVHTLGSGADQATGLEWIAMEHVAGPTLDEWLQSGPPDETIRSVIEQLLRAVAAAHALGVVHRDLKPSNIVIVRPESSATDPSSSPLLKVLDFGIAKGLDSATGSSTEAGLGTPLWTAPEQGQRGHVPHPSADVWSLGLLVFWLLTGRLYWLSANEPRASLADLVLELVKRPLESASERARLLGRADRLPAGFDGWFARCVTRDPAARFRNGGAALDALAPRLGLCARRRGAWRRLRAHGATSATAVTIAIAVAGLLAMAMVLMLAHHAGWI